MARIVVDASVVVKWYVPERNHESARALRDAYLDGDHDLLAPALLPFEVVNALKYSGHYDGDRLQEASTTVTEFGIEFVPYRDVGDVATVANELDLPLYDASYVSLADETDGTLYTADSRLLDDLDGPYGDLGEHVRDY